MDEKQLISHLRELREIRPRQDWVSLVKDRILSENPAFAEATADKASFISFFPLFRYKLAFAPIVSVFIIIGLFGFVSNTIPGDLLFSVKKITETAQISFSSINERPKTQLKLVNKRLEELSKIAGNNQVKSLDPAIKEFQASIVQATKDLTGMNLNVTSSDSMIVKEIIAESQKLEENKGRIEAVLGTNIGNTEELTNALRQLERQTAFHLIADLEERTLSENDTQLLNQARDDFNAGNYATSLEKIWLLSNK